MMRLRTLVVALAGCGLAMVVASGCGNPGGPRPPMGKVHGKVLLNGKPLTNGIVTFVPIPGKGGETGQSASGTVASDGSFSLTTFDTDDGAIRGQHIATVREDLNAAAAASGTSQGTTTGQMPDFSKKVASTKQQSTIPAKYTSVETSPLKYTVDRPDNDVTIELKD